MPSTPDRVRPVHRTHICWREATRLASLLRLPVFEYLLGPRGVAEVRYAVIRDAEHRVDQRLVGELRAQNGEQVDFPIDDYDLVGRHKQSIWACMGNRRSLSFGVRQD